MSEVYVMGDMHFGHKNIQNRYRTDIGVDTHEEYCDFLVEQWNSVVQKRDRVLILGDFMFKPEYLYYIRKLKGHKTVILGNHDYCDTKDLIISGIDNLQGALEYKGAIVTHIPIHPNETKFYKFNVHGHCHHKDDYGPMYYNAIPEVVGYKPISWKYIVEQMKIKQGKTNEQS